MWELVIMWNILGYENFDKKIEPMPDLSTCIQIVSTMKVQQARITDQKISGISVIAYCRPKTN